MCSLLMPNEFGVVGKLQRPVCPEALMVAQVMGPGEVKCLVAYYQALEVYNKAVASVAEFGAVAGSGVSSVGGSDETSKVGSDVSCGSSASSGRARRRRRAARRKKRQGEVGMASDVSYSGVVSGAPLVSPSEVDGCCYVAAATVEGAQTAAAELGTFPTFCDWLSSPAAWYCEQAMGECGVSRVGQVFHVSRGGVVPLVQCLASVLAAAGPGYQVRPGTLASMACLEVAVSPVLIAKAPRLTDRCGGSEYSGSGEVGGTVSGLPVLRTVAASGLGESGRHCKVCKRDSRDLSLHQVSVGSVVKSFLCETCIAFAVRSERGVWQDECRVAAVDKSKEPDKVWCAVCKCWVKEEGHSKRCTPTGGVRAAGAAVKHEDWNIRRKQAWVHDAVLLADVRMVALMRGISGPQLSSFQNKYTDNSALAAWYDACEDKSCLLTPVSSAVHARATVVEAMYVGPFRERFLLEHFGEDGRRVLANHQFTGVGF
jgi:hypothetical protein